LNDIEPSTPEKRFGSKANLAKVGTPPKPARQESPKSEFIIDDHGQKVLKRKQKVNIDANPPPPELNMPALWIRAADGGIKLLDSASPAPITDSVAADKKGKGKKGKQDKNLFAEFEKQQAELAKADKRKKSFYKPSSSDKAAYTTFNVDYELKSLTFTGVRITLDQNTEAIKMKDEDIQKQLLKQTQELEKEKRTVDKERKKDEHKTKKGPHHPTVRKRGQHHSRNITNTTYLFHLYQPNLMSPLFDLVNDRDILFGSFEGNLDYLERKCWERPLFRGIDHTYLPERVIDLSMPRLAV
jgi:hypothetical protein